MKARQKNDWMFVLLIGLTIPRILLCQGSVKNSRVIVKKKLLSSQMV